MDKLALLKLDLQMTTDSNDAFLESLLSAAEAAIQREGIIINDDADVQMAIVHYAAYLFRRRGGSDTTMPRFLRYELNNILVSQKTEG